MARITGSCPEDLGLLIEGATGTGVFGGKATRPREFAREYFDDYDDGRLVAAVTLYETITLRDVARLAGEDCWMMREILRDHGVAFHQK